MDQLSAVLTDISHPCRRAIIDNLAEGPQRFTRVAEPFDLALNSITKDLKLLDVAGLIQREKQRREVFISHRLKPLHLEQQYRNKKNKEK